jgi:hypothetical protein
MNNNGHRRFYLEYLEALAAKREAAGEVLPDIFDDSYWADLRSRRQPTNPPKANKDD